MTGPRTTLLVPAAESVLSNPAELAAEGDDQIRTGVIARRTSDSSDTYVYGAHKCVLGGVPR